MKKKNANPHQVDAVVNCPDYKGNSIVIDIAVHFKNKHHYGMLTITKSQQNKKEIFKLTNGLAVSIRLSIFKILKWSE